VRLKLVAFGQAGSGLDSASGTARQGVESRRLEGSVSGDGSAWAVTSEMEREDPGQGKRRGGRE